MSRRESEDELNEVYRRVVNRVHQLSSEGKVDAGLALRYLNELEDAIEPGAYDNITDEMLLDDIRVYENFSNADGTP